MATYFGVGAILSLNDRFEPIDREIRVREEKKNRRDGETDLGNMIM